MFLLKVLEQRHFPVRCTINKALLRFEGDKETPRGVIQNLLIGRGTGKLGDGTLAIGPLLKLPVSRLLDLMSEERVSGFWSTIRIVDRDCLS